MDTKLASMSWIALVIFIAGFHPTMSATVSNPPLPVTTTEGSKFVIRCGIASTRELEGVRVKRETEDTNTEETVYQSQPPSWKDTDFNKVKYELREIGNLDVEITVKNVVFEDAGTYTCEPILLVDERVDVAVVVLGKPLLTLPKIHHGEQFKAMCDVQFTAGSGVAEGDDHFPTVIGRVDEREYEGQTTYISGELGEVNSKLDWFTNVTLTSSDDGHDFFCVVRTKDPVGETSVSKPLSIHYEVSEPEIPQNDVFFVGEVIRCSAHGNPEPTIFWKPLTSKIRGSYEENLTIVEEMIGEPAEKWECECKNEPKGIPVVKTKEIIFTVEQKEGGGAGENVEKPDNTVAIAVGVTVPLVLILVAVGIVFFVFMRKGSKSKGPPLGDEVKANTLHNASLGDEDMNGKTGPLNPEDTYEEPLPPKPNSHGHNVRYQPDVDPAARAKRSETPLDPGLDRRSPYEPRYETVSEYPDVQSAPPYTAEPTDYPDMVAAHPGLQRAYNAEPTDYPDMASAHPGLQRAYNAEPTEYPDVASAHPGLQRAMSGDDHHAPSPTYSMVKKPKPQPRNTDPGDQYPDTEV